MGGIVLCFFKYKTIDDECPLIDLTLVKKMNTTIDDKLKLKCSKKSDKYIYLDGSF